MNVMTALVHKCFKKRKI